jgi:ribosomal protein L11 methyltransferase
MSDKRPPAEVGTTSASGGASNQESWKLSLPCTKAEAEAIAAAEVDGAVLVTTEEDEAAGRWRLDAYFEGEPDAATLAAVRSLVADNSEVQPEPLPPEDWVTLSQAGLEPIREGRFFVHTAAHADNVPAGAVAFRIEAGQAFGTGHHHTTAGCLAMLDGLAGERFGRVIDLGTGTGLLAFAARALWPDARVTATDIDPVAVAVSRENMAANGLNGIELIVADGARDPAIAAGAPYDLVIANILAGPLIAMADEVAGIAARGGRVLLAGLLTTQTEAVLAAYRAQGCVERRRLERGDWTILLLEAGGARGDLPNIQGHRNAWVTDT